MSNFKHMFRLSILVKFGRIKEVIIIMSWMVTDMTHNNALITNAMLASYASEKNITYLQMIEPFIIYSLPNKVESKIDVSKVAEKVYEEFGLDIKSKVVEKVLLNLSKGKSASNKVRYSKYKNYCTFYVNQKIDNTDFDNKRNFMKSLVSDVVKRLQEFINTEENIIKKITIKEAQSVLINFLDNYNADIYNNIGYVEKITIQENVLSNNYKVAKFIIAEYENELGCFDKIKQIQEGYFASIALYNFFENMDDEINRNNILKDTHVVLDTMLLVDALKLNTEYNADSMEELIFQIHDNGGTLYTFDYYVEELLGIIEKYASDREARISLDLDFFRRNNSSVAEVLLKSANIKDSVDISSKIPIYKNIEINILKTISYDELIENQTWHIDVTKLEQEITKNISYISTLSFRNDCNTIERILYEKQINNINYIFLSSNSSLIFSAKNFAGKEYKNLFFTDIDLAAKIWLSNYNSKSKLSELMLLQNAYAALTPTKEILNEVLQVIENNLNASDEELQKNALLLRYDDDLLYHISVVIKNDKNNINKNTQNALINSLTQKIRNNLKNDVESEIKELYKEKEIQLKDDIFKANQKASKISLKESRLDKREKDLNNREQHLNHIDEEKKILENELSLAKEQLYNIKESANKRNKILSKIIVGFFSLLCATIFGIVFFFIVYMLFMYCVKNLLKTDLVNNVYQICTLISFLITIGSILLLYFKITRKIIKKLENIIYQFLCKHSKILTI